MRSRDGAHPTSCIASIRVKSTSTLRNTRVIRLELRWGSRREPWHAASNAATSITSRDDWSNAHRVARSLLSSGASRRFARVVASPGATRITSRSHFVRHTSHRAVTSCDTHHMARSLRAPRRVASCDSDHTKFSSLAMRGSTIGGRAGSHITTEGRRFGTPGHVARQRGRGGGVKGAPDRIRTCDRSLRRRLLYPTELPGRRRPGRAAEDGRRPWAGVARHRLRCPSCSRAGGSRGRRGRRFGLVDTPRRRR